jgi:YD repeat-containing protein
VSGGTHLHLLGSDFSPIHEVSREEYVYDDADRLIEVIAPGGYRTELEYDEGGNVSRESLHTPEGNVIRFHHTYDEGRNPFYELERRQGGVSVGLISVPGSSALYQSPRNVLRTETRVDGREGVVSVRTVEIREYDPSGYPLRAVQELKNTDLPDGSIFFAEYEYEPVR